MNKRLRSTKVAPSFSARNSSALASAFAVQLPRLHWFSTGEHFERKSTLASSFGKARAIAPYNRSRWSGKSGNHPYHFDDRVLILAMSRVLISDHRVFFWYLQRNISAGADAHQSQQCIAKLRHR